MRPNFQTQSIEVGVRWFHGHASGVKLDGLYGAFIVHPKEKIGIVLQFSDILLKLANFIVFNPIFQNRSKPNA